MLIEFFTFTLFKQRKCHLPKPRHSEDDLLAPPRPERWMLDLVHCMIPDQLEKLQKKFMSLSSTDHTLGCGCGIRKTQVQIPALPPTGWKILGNLFAPSEPQMAMPTLQGLCENGI